MAVVITPTYLADLARVRVNATGLTGPTVTVSRSDDAGHTYATIRGGAGVAVAGGAISIDDYEFVPGVIARYRITDGVTNNEALFATTYPTSTWLKTPLRPFLNRAVTTTGASDVSREGRGGSFEVIGRSLPVLVSDVMAGRAWSLSLYTATKGERDGIMLALTFGEAIFFQPAYACAGVLPDQGWYRVASVTERRPPRHDSIKRYLELALLEVAAPDMAVGGYTATYGAIAAAYATYAALAAAFGTYLALSQYVASPSDVIVG